MAIQIDYFTAPSDAEAAATADLEAGPRAEREGVVTSQDVDPGLALGYLNELLTGVPVDEFVTNGWPSLVAESTDEQKFVLQVDPGFVVLMSTREAPFDGLAQQWAAVDADDWSPQVAHLTEFLAQFTALAQQAGSDAAHVYCWLWP